MSFKKGIIDYTSATPTIDTWDPARTDPGAVLSGGNLIASYLSGTFPSGLGLSLFAKSTGKWYFEVTITNFSSAVGIGVGNTNAIISTNMGNDTNSVAMYGGFAEIIYNAANAGSTPAYSTGAVIGVAFDATAQKIWWSINGTFVNSGNPTLGLLPNLSGMALPYMPAFTINSGGIVTANFGQSAFAFSVPVGFTAGIF